MPDDVRIAELEEANRALREVNLELAQELIDRSAEAGRSLAAAQQEIAAIRGSLRWRLLHPFEGLLRRSR